MKIHYTKIAISECFENHFEFEGTNLKTIFILKKK